MESPPRMEKNINITFFIEVQKVRRSQPKIASVETEPIEIQDVFLPLRIPHFFLSRGKTQRFIPEITLRARNA